MLVNLINDEAVESEDEYNYFQENITASNQPINLQESSNEFYNSFSPVFQTNFTAIKALNRHQNQD